MPEVDEFAGEVRDLSPPVGVVGLHGGRGVRQFRHDGTDRLAAERGAQPLESGESGKVGLAGDGVLRPCAQYDRHVRTESERRIRPIGDADDEGPRGAPAH